MPFFDKLLENESYEPTALVGLCDVSFKGEVFENERIRLDLERGVVRIEASKFDSWKVPFGRPAEGEFIVSNVSIHSRGVHLTTQNLEYSFVGSIGGGSFGVHNTHITSVTGFHSRPASISLICNRPIEFEVNKEAYERRFFTQFDFHQIQLNANIYLNGSKQGFSLIGEEVFNTPNVDNAVSVVVGLRSAWASEWRANKLRIRLSAYKNTAKKGNPIISLGEGGFVSLDETSKNAQMLFPLTLQYLNGLDEQNLSRALVGVDALLSSRQYGVAFMLGCFGVFRFWEWADNAKTISREPLAKCLNISSDEARALVGFRNDLIHGREFFHQAIKKCDKLLRECSYRYLIDFDMMEPAASVMNYIHSLSGEALMRIIGYEGDVQKYFPNSGSTRLSNPLEKIKQNED